MCMQRERERTPQRVYVAERERTRGKCGRLPFVKCVKNSERNHRPVEAAHKWFCAKKGGFASTWRGVEVGRRSGKVRRVIWVCVSL